jgi:hypothetical protein
MAHIALPLIATLALVALYYMPIGVVGRTNRGLLALIVALASAAGAVVTGGRASRANKRGDPSANWWLTSTVLLLVPVLLLVWPLG